MIKYFYILLSVFIFLSSCKKPEMEDVIYETIFTIEIEEDKYNDTLYIVKDVNIITSNDTISKKAKIIVTDENNVTYYNDYWKNIRGLKISFNKGDTLDFDFNLYLDNTKNSVKILTETISSNNITPDFIQILSISSNINLSDIYFGLNSNYNTQILISNSILHPTVYYCLNYKPSNEIFYSFDSLFINTKNTQTIWDSELCNFYGVSLNYPIETLNGQFDYYKKHEIEAFLSGYKPDTIYEYSAQTIDWFQNNIITIKYKCIYEE